MAYKSRRGGLLRFLAWLMAGAIVAGGLFWLRSQQFANHPVALAGPGPAVLIVEPGDGFNTVLAKLRGAGIQQGSSLEWKAQAIAMRVADRLQAGEYEIVEGMTPREILSRLARGEVIQRKFTIVEGWNFRDLRRTLKADAQLAGTIGKIDDQTLMRKLGRSGQSPEGRFLPETYVYTRGATDLQILDRAANAMDEALAGTWKSRATELPYRSADELLTMASIVEKETGVPAERPMIAGVFVRRLKIGMRLQTDPTVIYGIGNAYDGNIRRKDLETDTPYNSYLRPGLPPTPIAMPGKLALQAAAHPGGGNALYFVASGAGGHQFSASLDEHNAAVRKYQLKR